MQGMYRVEVLDGNYPADEVCGEIVKCLTLARYDLIKKEGAVAWFEKDIDFTRFHMTTTMIARLMRIHADVSFTAPDVTG
jgi:hypothetical protein